MLQYINSDLLAQQTSDSDKVLHQKFESYVLLKKDDKLYLHLDKTLYTNNETIWFTGYLANAQSSTFKDHNFLSVHLCQEDDSKILLEHRFLMDNGVSFGNITLPDTIVPGNYKLLAYTNVVDGNGKPIALFQQQITIKSVTDDNFNAMVSLTNPEAKDFFKIEVNISKDSSKEFKNPILSFVNNNLKKTIIKDESKGIYLIEIPVKEAISYKKDIVLCVDYKNRLKYFQVKLPLPATESFNVKFYPEGGYLTHGVVNQVAWEVKKNIETAINTSAILYRGNDIVDTIKTEGYGIGKFKIIPDSKYNYSVRLIKNGKVDSNIFYLPGTNAIGIALNLKKAVVNDTLSVNLMVNKAQNITLLVHNYHGLFANFPIKASIGKLNFNIDLNAVPRGVATLTILDSLRRPIIERLFFAHHKIKNELTIETDRDNYKIRDSTKVKIKLGDYTLNQLKSGSVSVAVVQSNRIESNKQTKIDSYFLLSNELKGISAVEANVAYHDVAYLENILLVKGWRKYLWSELSASHYTAPKDTLKNLLFSGDLSYYGKELKKITSITLINDSTFKLINTNALGHFTLPYNDIIVGQGKKVWLMVNNSAKDGYKIKINEPSLSVAEYFDQEIFNNYESFDNNLVIKNNRAIILNDVTIKSSNSNLLYKAPIPYIKTNLCGDYLCVHRHLNCQIVSHLFKTSIPTDGTWYLPNENRTFTTTRSFGNATTASTITTIDRIEYRGCWLDRKRIYELSKMAGIEISKEFYQPDANESIEDDYRSTVYWNHGLIADEKGEINFTFTNSNVVDKFKIVVQGINNNNLIYGEHEFNVTRP